MDKFVSYTISRRTALGGLFAVSFSGAASAQKLVAPCNAADVVRQNNVYEFDIAGKSVEWDFPSGNPVQADCKLQAWAETVSTDGKIRGFGEFSGGKTLSGEIQSRSYLVRALTMIIFTASVQHAAVNFTQADFGDSLPAGIYRDYFSGVDVAIEDYLPNETHFKEVMNTLSIVSASQYTTLGKYHENTSAAKRLRSVKDYFKPTDVRASLKIFQAALSEIEGDIEGRVSDAHGRKYDYLLPSRIPQSANV